VLIMVVVTGWKRCIYQSLSMCVVFVTKWHY